MDDLERRHRELIERDRWVGLEAEADAARAHAAYLQEKLDVAQMRLDRKNARIRSLAARVRELERAQGTSGVADDAGRLRSVVGRVTRRG